MTDRNDRAIAALTAAMLVYFIVTSHQSWVYKLCWLVSLAIASTLYIFWDHVQRLLPVVVLRFGRAIKRFLTHPVVFIVIAFGLLAATFATGHRYLLIALALVITILEVPRLRWQDLLRHQGSRSATSKVEKVASVNQSLIERVETIEGDPRPVADSADALELPYQGSPLNTFVLLRDLNVNDVQVEFDALLQPGALLNIVVRYNTEQHSGYIIRVDSRMQPRLTDGILIMRNGMWQPLLESTHSTPAQRWVHVSAIAHGQNLQLWQDGQEICSAVHPELLTGRIGFFNEVGDAAIRNVIIDI